MVAIITEQEARKILLSEGSINLSLDLGLSETEVIIKNNLAHIGKNKVPLQEFKKVKPEACYIIEDNEVKKLAFFSDKTNLYYKMIPTRDWPTFALSSTPMHQHHKLSPKQDTELKIEGISPIKGRVLDTCCGFGYTAILCSREAEEVYTFERDKNVLRLAEFNPYSSELFSNKKIKVKNEDISSSISKFKSEFFDRVIHDPPTVKLSPSMYSPRFHRALFRVMKKGGILYHYCPRPGKMKGKEFHLKLISNLRRAGFSKIEYKEASSGVIVVK